MKRLLLIFCIFLFSLELLGQPHYESSSQTINRTSHSFGDVSISISPNVLFGSTDESIIAGGFKVRMFVGQRFSFDSDLVLGHNYVHFGPGIIGLPLWYFGYNLGFSSDEENSLTEFLIMGAIMLLSAEHFAYHIPIKSNIDISPYLSFLRFKQISGLQDALYPDGINSSAYCVVGLEINSYFKRFVLSPYVDYDISYSDQGHGLNIGLNLGYYIPAKNKK